MFYYVKNVYKFSFVNKNISRVSNKWTMFSPYLSTTDNLCKAWSMKVKWHSGTGTLKITK